MTEPTYEYNITSIKTKDVEGVGTIVKQISYDVVGTLQGLTRTESRTVLLPEDAENAVLSTGITKELATAAILKHADDLFVVKRYIKDVLTKQVEEQNLQETPLPW